MALCSPCSRQADQRVAHRMTELRAAHLTTRAISRANNAGSLERNLRRWAWGLTALTIGWDSLEAIIAS